MGHVASTAVAASLAVIGFLAGRGSSPAQAQPQAPTNYLLIDECQLPSGVVFNDAIAEASRFVKEYRKTGEYKNVRLFVHNYGPSFSLYTISEPRSWAAIPAGFSKMVEANPTVMTKPFPCSGHSDNILTEVVVL
jgi:hypothetical protein